LNEMKSSLLLDAREWNRMVGGFGAEPRFMELAAI
jgi:hypothetical protein